MPFEAVTAFFDPAVQFGFQFETIEGTATADANAAARRRQISRRPAVTAAGPAEKRRRLCRKSRSLRACSRLRGTGGEVVRLDRFRKK